MKRAVTAVLAIAVVAGLALAAVAVADRASRSDPSGDVKHDPPGKDARYDIVRVAYGHSGSKLTATVKTKGKTFTFDSTDGAPPLLWIDVPGKVSDRAGCQYSDYFVIDGEVDECGDGPKTGDATVTKVDSHTLRFKFGKAAIGKPSKFGIAFVQEAATDDGKLLFYDRAPNKGFFRHKL
jgi:hypothetical protein